MNKKSTQKISIQERCANKALDAFGEVEYQIDEYMSQPYGNKWRCLQYLNSLAYSSMVVKYMKGQLDSQIAEVENKEGCEQLAEGYSHFNAKEKKGFIKFLKHIDEDIDTYCKNNKPIRKKRIKTPAQQVKNLTYLSEWEKYKSIDPVEIPRARMLFTYNTSSKKLTKFEGHLSVKGSRINGYDECSEKTLTDLRLLDRLVEGGNIIASKFMDEIPRSKLKDGNDLPTKNTLLIKVIK